METWIIWLIAAILLIAVEVLTQMVWTLCLAIGCMAGLIASLCGVDPAWQIALTGLVSIIAYFALVPLLKKWQRRNESATRHEARTGMDALLGRRGTVTSEIKPGEMGRIRIDGDNWQAKAPGAARVINRGETVVVDDYDSIILTVQPENK